MSVVTRTTRGRALIDGRVVCDDVRFTESADERYVRVAGSSGYKDLSVGLPSEISFVGWVDNDLRRRLERIASVYAANDVQAARRLRDQGEGAIAIDLDLDLEGQRELLGCSVSAPINPFGVTATLRFPISHP